jgi:ABC-2 type transport system permease protein
MNGFSVLMGKELSEQIRTMRIVGVAAVFVLFGIISPLTAKYLPDIIKAVASDQFPVGMIPTPTTADAVDQFLKNLSQFGILAAILLSMGAVATEKDRGTAGFVLTKPVSRLAFLAAKISAISLNLLIAIVLAGVAAYWYTAILFEAIPIAGFAASVMVLWLSLVVFAALTFLGSTIAGSALVGAGFGIVALVVTGLVGVVPGVARFMPQGLIGIARDLALGTAPGADAIGPIVANVVFFVAVLGIAWLSFRRQEL